ncbi:hypothetical protein BX600DRAFT_266435 [Xylariales sp. PMI_506]|nr:hypothetical protein BX600DRAFT_266435 [Xylariales sp. PMI_506]
MVNRIAAAAAATLLPILASGTSFSIADLLSLGPTTPEHYSVAGGLDQPKLSPLAANATSYDWWYFDAVSASTDQSLTLVFYDAGPLGFLEPFDLGPLSVSLAGSFSDGLPFDIIAPALGGVSIENTEDGGISADWVGSGFNFTGTSLDSASPIYTISIDAPDFGVEGTIKFQGRAPAHYPCGPNEANQDQLLMPNVYWANALPDALVTVDLTIYGVKFAFDDGVGYHDKNWGDSPFLEATTSWYWGHAYLEPYSIVWFDAVDSAGEEHFSGYVVKDGEVVGSSCAENAVVVRPWGKNSDYPPTVLSGIPQGIEAKFDLGSEGSFVANITTGLVALDAIIYFRALGTVTGGFEGSDQYDGRAFFDVFKLAV